MRWLYVFEKNSRNNLESSGEKCTTQETWNQSILYRAKILLNIIAIIL